MQRAPGRYASCSSARPSSARACRCCCGAFEALREHVPATLTLVGARPEEVAPLLLDDRGVRALGKVSDERKAAELATADVLCAPSLGGESFGMVLTEAFAAGTPGRRVGHRRLPRRRARRHRRPARPRAATPCALAEALRALALDPGRRAAMAAAARERAERFAWPRVAAEVARRLRAGASPPAARASGPEPARAPRGAQRHQVRRPAPARSPPARPAEPRAAPTPPRRRGHRVGAPRGRSRSVLRRGVLAASRSPASRWRWWRSRRSGWAASPPASSPPARPGRGRPGPDVRRDGRARPRMARDPQCRPHMAHRAALGRDAGHVHRRADVRHAARPTRRAVAGAGRRAAPRAPARDPPGGARDDGLPDAAEPARARDPRDDHALRGAPPARPRRGAGRRRHRPAGGAGAGAARPRARAALGDLALGAGALAGARAAPRAAARPRGPARLSPAPPGRHRDRDAAVRAGRCSARRAGCC